MSKYALKCWSSDENYNADFDYALVDLTPKLVDVINSRRNLYTTCAAQDSRLSSMQFFDFSPEYFAECDIVQWAEDTHDDHDPEFLNSLLDGSEFELIPDEFSPKDDGG